MLLYQISPLLYMKKQKKSYNNNKFKIWALKWDKKLKVPTESYSVLDIPDYCEYILKKHGENTDNPSIWIYVKKIENRITFKARYYLKLSTAKTIKLLGNTKSKITKKKNGENVIHSEITEAVICTLWYR